VIQQRANFDWMLKDLADGVPGIQQIVVLSADGLRIARFGGDPDTADRVAAACAGLQSLAGAVAGEIPQSDGQMRMVIIEINGGYFYLMAAGPTPISRCSPTRPRSPG
jgi:predicted regulator of Ras-like GTPase activity (Roadblock/LC7/MglB family)